MFRRLVLGLLALAASAPACSKPLPPLPPPDPRECTRAVGQSRLLLVGPSGHEIAVEITKRLSANQLVPVHVEGCNLRIVEGCAPKHDWYYVGYQPVQRDVRIRSEAELFANVASVDEPLRRQLANAQELKVRTVISGRWDWAIDQADPHALHLDHPEWDTALTTKVDPAACKSATHVVTAMYAAAFAVFAEGTRSGSFDEKPAVHTLEEEGDIGACTASRPGDKEPPKRCGDGFAIEILPIGGVRRVEPACTGHTQWNGTQCADACGVGFDPKHCSS